jgi:hypothetical protein
MKLGNRGVIKAFPNGVPPVTSGTVIFNPISSTVLEWLRLEVVNWRQEFSFLIKHFSAAKFGAALGPTSHLSNITVVFLGIKRPGREANHAPPPSAVVRNVRKHPPPRTSHGMVFLLNTGVCNVSIPCLKANPDRSVSMSVCQK